ncbi:MAG: DJ-1 family protein, partial [Spirochaetae bacterium HGW-Spirochaetae-8]
MNENGNGRVLIVLAQGFEEMEALVPVDILRRAGLKVVLAGVGSKTITGGHGITVACDTEIEIAGTDFNAIVLPGGGQGSKNLAASWAVNEKLLLIANSGAIVAAICAAPAVVLWPTGLLEG